MADKNTDAVVGSIQRRAMEIIELPPDQREARYKVYRQTYIESVMEKGLSREKGEQFAATMEEWTRTLVKLIEAGGATRGGRA